MTCVSQERWWPPGAPLYRTPGDSSMAKSQFVILDHDPTLRSS
jgi:hypothetical protein